MTIQEDVQKRRKVPCVYIGNHPIRLSPDGRPYFDAQGLPLKSLDLAAGDTLMLPEVEVSGMTFWHDRSGALPSEFIGVGRCVKADHVDKTFEELLALGYEFHDGRADFLALPAPAPAEAQEEAPASSQQEQAPPTPPPTVPAPDTAPVEPAQPQGPVQTQAPVVPFVAPVSAAQNEEVS